MKPPNGPRLHLEQLLFRELLPHGLTTETADKSFALATDDAKESATLASALFKPSTDALSLGKEPGTLSFEYRSSPLRSNR